LYSNIRAITVKNNVDPLRKNNKYLYTHVTFSAYLHHVYIHRILGIPDAPKI